MQFQHERDATSHDGLQQGIATNLRLTGMPNIAVASAYELEDATANERAFSRSTTLENISVLLASLPGRTIVMGLANDAPETFYLQLLKDGGGIL